jgi:hypothetical protein
MKRLDKVIQSFGFNIDEEITDKSRLYVIDKSIAFNIRQEMECDVYIGSRGRYYKVGRIISRILRRDKFVPNLEVCIDNPKLLTQNRWWDA